MPAYDTGPIANRAFDETIAKRKLKNDAALALLLEISPNQISNMRHGRVKFGNAVQMRLLQNGGMSQRRLNELLEGRK